MASDAKTNDGNDGKTTISLNPNRITKTPTLDDMDCETTIRNAYKFSSILKQKKEMDESRGWFEAKCNTLPLYNPAGSFLHCWHFCVTFMLIYACIEVPVTFTFHLNYPQLQHLNTITWYQVLSLLANLILAIDVGISFRTAYFDKFDKLMLIIDPRLIAKHYIFSKWFVIDLITCIPFQLVATNNEHGWLRYFIGLIRLLMFVRLAKMWRLFNKFSREFVKIREVRHFLTLFKLLLWMFMFAHYAGCLWWFIGELEGSFETSWIIQAGADEYEGNTFKQYSISFYWAVVTLFTTGYGDITATNTLEQWVCALCILIGTCFFSYFIGALTVIIFEGDSTTKYKMDAIENAYHFCEHKRLSRKIRRAIITHTRYHCDYNYVFDEDCVMMTLPPHLQVDIRRDLGKQLLSQIDIFHKLSDDILGSLALKMRSVSCNSGYVLFAKGDRARDIYIQRTGECELHLNDSDETQMITKRGAFLGEDAFIKRNRKHTVHCNSWAEFYVLAIADITDVLENDYVDSDKFTKRWNRMIRVVESHNNSKDLQKIDLNRAEEDESDDEGDGFYTATRIPTMKFLGETSVITDFTGKLMTKMNNKATRKMTHTFNKKMNLKKKIMTKRDSYIRDAEITRIHTKRQISRGVSAENDDNNVHLSVEMVEIKEKENENAIENKNKNNKMHSQRFSAARLSGIMNGPKLLATVDDSESDDLSDSQNHGILMETPITPTGVPINNNKNDNNSSLDHPNDNGNDDDDSDEFPDNDVNNFDVSFIHNLKTVDDDDGDSDGDYSEHTPIPDDN